MMTTKLVPAVALAMALVTTGAPAQISNQPQSGEVTASFGLSEVARSQDRTCQGADGTYLEFHQEHTGPILSTDERLGGTLTTNTFILVNRDTGLGTAHGTFQIRDSVTDALKVTADFDGALGPGGRFKGLATGKVLEGGPAFLTAAISIVFGVATSVGDMGAPAGVVLSDLAVIQQGSCSGGFGSSET
jgi:phage-related minor tail protein